MQILIDMDGVIADFENGFISQWKKQHPDKEYIPYHERSTLKIIDQYPLKYKKLAQEIYCHEGFFRSLRPIPKSIESLQRLLELGHNVFICSTPLNHYRNCVLEKYEWIEIHLGFEWTRRLILTRDKTLVCAQILIDDDPDIEGIRQPEWEKIIYDQPWNKRQSGKRLAWDNWQDVLQV